MQPRAGPFKLCRSATFVAALCADKPAFLMIDAGYTGKSYVDSGELQKANFIDNNAVLPWRIAEVRASVNVPLDHVSPGCIYTECRPDGSGQLLINN